MKTKNLQTRWINQKAWLILILLSISAGNFINAQTIFTESMGTVGGTTTIVAHEAANGFSNVGYTMTNGGATLPADLRATSTSSLYAGATGGANVYFTATPNQYGFAIEGIDASLYSTLVLNFGYRKESAPTHATFAVEYWNGSAWINVANTSAALFNEAVGAGTGWYLSKSLSLPVGAQIAGLKIRFLKSGSIAIRVDDVKLTGTTGTPTLTPSVASLTGFNYVVGSGPSSNQSFTFTGSDLTGFPGNITVDAGVTAYEVSTDGTSFFSSVTYPFTMATLGVQTVYVRLKASQPAASYNLQAISITGGAATAGITASGVVDPNTPQITVGTITPSSTFTTNAPTPSAVSTFTVNGINLTDPLTVSAVVGYEYSDNGGFSWTTSPLSYNTVTVSKTISVRLVGLPAGTFNGTISIESLTAINSPSTISLTGDVVLVPTITDIIMPQYIKGAGTGRLPYVFKVTINNLTPNATYRYYNTAVSGVDPADGAGVPIFAQGATWVHSTSVSMNTLNGYAEFNSDGAGNYTGWFAIANTTNTRFTAGNQVYMRIALNNGAGGTSVASRATTTNFAKAIDLVPSAGANNGTAIRSVSNAQAKDFIFLYDNDLGTGRPISGTYFESEGTTNATAATFYSGNVDGVAKAWGTIIPNTLPNGIRYVASYSNATGSQLCTFSDADGVWPTGSINTVNPAGGNTVPLVLANADVPMQCFLLPYANLSLSSGTGSEASGTVITITASITGTLASPQTVDVDISGLGITLGDYSISGTTITIPAGVNPSGFVTLTVLDDILSEGLEVANISLLNPSVGIELGFNIALDLNINDNDVPKIVINEIMYNNVGNDEEWIELYNNDVASVLIDDTWSIQGTPSSGGPWTRTFPPLTAINLAPGQYITVQVGSAGSFPFAPTVILSAAADQLTNTGAPLILRQGAAIIDNVTYSSVTFTPAAGGFGPSLSLNNPNSDNSLAASWGACNLNGSPNLKNFNCDAATYYTINSGNLNPDVFNVGSAIWTDTPAGVIGLCPPFKATTNYVVRNTHTVVLNYGATTPSMNNLTVNTGGKLYTNINTSGSEKYIKLFGNIVNSGVIGNGVTYDAIGFSMEGTTNTLSGFGSYNIGRIRKDFVTNPTSTCVINANVNLRFPGTAFYNNIANGTLNLTINAGKTLTLTDVLGDFSIDGVTGTGLGNINGDVTVNGNLVIGNKLYAVTNNTVGAPCSLTINSTGKVTVGDIDANITGNGGALGAFPITINAGGKLNISGILKVVAGDLNSNGGITLISTSTKTALIDGTGGGNVIGNTSVQRKIGTVSGYHYLSSPVSGSIVNNTVNGWRDDFTIDAATNGLIFTPGSQPTSLFPTVWEYDETVNNPNPAYGYVGATSTITPITPLKGFACIVPANVVVDVFGAVNNGLVTYNVTKTDDGLNLIGNPYPSPISWSSFRTSNAHLSPVYQAFVSTGSYAGNYGFYDAVSTSGSLGVGNVIASSQAFMVTSASSASTQALNTHRTLDLNPTFFNSNTAPNLIKIEVAEGDFKDQTVIYFDANENDNYNAGRDALKLYGPEATVASIYSVAAGKNLNLNVLGQFNQDKIVPLGVRAAHNGMHTLSVADLSSFDPTAMVFLIDNQTGLNQNLRVNNSYTVNLNAGTIDNRFFIKFTPALIVTATATTCVGNDGKLDLNYPSSSLVNIDVKNQAGVTVANVVNFNGPVTIPSMIAGNYQIEVTYVGGYTASTYVTIDEVLPTTIDAQASTNTAIVSESVLFTSNANNNANVSWNFGDGSSAVVGANVSHTFATAGNYNVQATASNGLCLATETISLSVTSATGINNLTQNGFQWLVSDNKITLTISNDLKENGIIQIYDAIGNLITQKQISINKGIFVIDLDDMPQGVYFAKYFSNKTTSSKKFVINK